jgi:hypothetical protein
MDEPRTNGVENVENILVELRQILLRLDQTNAPAPIGAQLSLAIERLESFIGESL